MKTRMKLALAVFAALSVIGGSSCSRNAKTTLAVVVDEKTYAAIPEQVDAYVKSVDNSYRTGVLVVDKWYNPDSIKAHLFDMDTNSGL